METSTFNKMLGQESENLAVKVFTDTCCNGCECKAKADHKLESSCVCGNESCNC